MRPLSLSLQLISPPLAPSQLTRERTPAVEFCNANFQRGQPDLLCMIHRKVKTDGAVVPSTGTDGTLDLSSLITDLAAIRKHQTAISADLKELQARNHALWQEAVQSREKHKKQEETINKILRFLAGVFGGHVLDQSQQQQDRGAPAPSPQVKDDAGTPDSSASAPDDALGLGLGASGSGSGARGGGGGAKGKGKGKHGVVVMPKGRLLLEDVKGRQQQQQQGAALRELDGSDDEIEEIPLLRGDQDDGLPTISSCAYLSLSLPLPHLPSPSLAPRAAHTVAPPRNSPHRLGPDSQHRHPRALAVAAPLHGHPLARELVGAPDAHDDGARRRRRPRGPVRPHARGVRRPRAQHGRLVGLQRPVQPAGLGRGLERRSVLDAPSPYVERSSIVVVVDGAHAVRPDPDVEPAGEPVRPLRSLAADRRRPSHLVRLDLERPRLDLLLLLLRQPQPRRARPRPGRHVALGRVGARAQPLGRRDAPRREGRH